jgi:GTPase SAR1 family protein
MIYDITDRYSFERLAYMYETVSAFGFPIEFILIGNKSDLSKEREVTYEEGARLAAKYNIPFFEVSAKTSLNVNDAVETVAGITLMKHLDEYQYNEQMK